MALILEDYICHASGQRVENCSSRYGFLNDERDGAIFIFKDIFDLVRRPCGSKQKKHFLDSVELELTSLI